MKLIPTGKRKGFPFFIVMFLGFTFVQAQSWEIGLGLGGTTYTGDIVRTYRFLDNRPAGMAFVRYNLNNSFSVRAAGMVGSLQAEDRDNPVDLVAETRNASFKRLALEGTVTVEYHFLDYKSEKSLVNYSPYLFAGAGMAAFTNKGPEGTYNRMQPVIPVGLGFKYLINPNWTLGVEFGARKTFFDYIDEISGGEQIRKSGFQFGNAHDNDWYYFLGFTLSYTFYQVPCPYNPNNTLYE